MRKALVICFVLFGCRQDDGAVYSNRNININNGGTSSQVTIGGTTRQSVSIAPGWNLEVEVIDGRATVRCCPSTGGNCHLHLNGRGCPSN